MLKDNEEGVNRDIYLRETREELMDDDEISAKEEGFMHGYEDDEETETEEEE